ncbi:hypothetical protein U1Q18_034025 [Sarracenia purpurea var. burkii]
MAVKDIYRVNPARNTQGFMNNLSYMASEWLLIFLLFVDAALSYLLTKFARYHELQTPCLLCSRLDHVFGSEKPEFYRSLLCKNHSMEISSLISCHIHGRLADARGMCEECLTSFLIQNKANSESNRLLVGKLGIDLDHSGFHSPFLNKNTIPGSLSTRTCSCCNKMWRARSNAQRLLQLPIGFGMIKSNSKPPLPRLPGHGRLSRRDSLKKLRDKISGPITPPLRLGKSGVDPLSHVGYSELRINSDTESEFPFSDDDDRGLMIRERTDPKEALVVHQSSAILPKAHTDNLAPVKQTQQTSDPGPSLLDQCIQLHVSEPRDVECLASDDVIGHGLGELNWEQANPKPYPPALPELISLDDVPPPSNVLDVSVGLSENKPSGPPPQDSGLFLLSELIITNDISPSSKTMEIPVAVSPKNSGDAIGTRDIGHTSVIKHEEVPGWMSTAVADFKTDQTLTNTAPSISNDVGPSDEYKFSISNKGTEVSGMLAEFSVSGESAKAHNQILSVHGIGLSSNDGSPRFRVQNNELLRSDASSSNEIQVLQKSPSLEGNDTGYESLDGISVGEIEDESIVDKLKRQVEYDRRCMSTLYKELEEERNASEVAANQAMAMITRLQEEKASLHMEALQYLRMMEEQAEYDMEALEKVNDLLAEKEKEVQDLEAELEFYRVNLPHEVPVENLTMEICNSKSDNIRFENNGLSHIKHNADMHFDSMSTKMSDISDKNNNIKTSLLDFEGEKLYISQWLIKLEKKLHQVSGHGAKYPTKSLTNGEIQTDHQKVENGLLVPKDLSVLNASLSTLEGSDVSDEDNSYVIKENNHLDSDRQETSMHGGEIDLIALENEISELNGRLEALEADRDLLEHAFSSIRNGNDGLQFIKEIACQLRELRKIGIDERC